MDHRNRTDRIEIQTDQWNVQMPRLVSAYLESHHHDEGEWLPKVSVQSGQSLEIDVADVFCTFDIFLIHLRLLLILFCISSAALLISGLARGLVPE